jgi:hypothetical protein
VLPTDAAGVGAYNAFVPQPFISTSGVHKGMCCLPGAVESVSDCQ